MTLGQNKAAINGEMECKCNTVGKGRREMGGGRGEEEIKEGSERKKRGQRVRDRDRVICNGSFEQSLLLRDTIYV